MRYLSLKKNGDFLRAYKRGKNYVTPFVVLYVNKNRAKKTRVGITASKKIGNAVARNRARRIIRHALFSVLPADVGGFDFVLVARGKTPYMKSTDLVPVLKKLFTQAGFSFTEREK